MQKYLALYNEVTVFIYPPRQELLEIRSLGNRTNYYSSALHHSNSDHQTINSLRATNDSVGCMLL